VENDRYGAFANRLIARARFESMEADYAQQSCIWHAFFDEGMFNRPGPDEASSEAPQLLLLLHRSNPRIKLKH
jgi:hypothetical protein